MLTNCCNGVIGSNSARFFRRPAPILRKPAVQQLLVDNKGCEIIEIGAGCLRNALYVQRLGYKVTVVDLPLIRERFPSAYRRFEAGGGRFITWPQFRGAIRRRTRAPSRRLFELAIMTFVIETICSPQARLVLLRQCKALLKPDASLVISVRGVADVLTADATGAPCSDGYLTPIKTFIRPYDRPQLQRLLRGAGFRAVRFLHDTDTLAPEILHAIAEA